MHALSRDQLPYKATCSPPHFPISRHLNRLPLLCAPFFPLSSLGNFLPILRAFSCTMSLLVNHPSPRIMTERRLQAFSSTANHLKISKDLPQDLQDIYCASVQSSLPQVQVSASSGVHQQTVNCSLQVRAKTVEVICQNSSWCDCEHKTGRDGVRGLRDCMA